MSSITFSESDPFSPIRYTYSLKRIVHEHRSPFGEVKVAEHDYFGRMLILNDVVQLTERDEYFYHEMLAHVPLHAHPSPSQVLIIGGGDGGTLREVLKHEQVGKAILVEIDQAVVETSKRFLPTLSTGFADPRAEGIFTEGSRFISQHKDSFDVVLVDCTDPVGPAESLFTDRFFSHASNALKDDGIVVLQTESLHFHLEFIRQVQDRLRGFFSRVDLYTVPVATYAGNWWTFSVASKVHDPRLPLRPCSVSTRYYAEDVHRNAFLAPSLYRRWIA
jgi:spermidine synthase